ncbi:FluC/FEX family fluoride channel [Aquipuribacter sp. MA13-6]|uniref:FluC/FEX family fluoride channel n=1 Tax=unclassified Aquipuribacter TaxID=2635084 RepID=UPI003EECDF19
MSRYLPSGQVLLAVGIGGAVGGAARVGAGLLAASSVPDLPVWVVLVAVNVVGSFVMGLLVARGGAWASPALTTGLLGGFTSFSGWVLDVMRLAEASPLPALLVLVLVPVATVAACLVGLVAGGETT